MNRQQALTRARDAFSALSVEDMALESELLLRHALGIDRVQLYLDISEEISLEQESNYQHLVQRRLNGEPSAYITENREFYGIYFYVDPRVLIPRPESELLVEKAVNLAQHRAIATIAEIGTGCGAIAISLALSLPQTRIYATDISAPALKVAMRNTRRHGVEDRICLLEGDMLAPLPEPVDLIIANLPYVREAELPPTGEPPLALNGGAEGLDKVYQLCHELSSKLHPRGSALLEIGQGQGKPVATLLGSLFPSARIEVTPDFSGIERVVSLLLTQG